MKRGKNMKEFYSIGKIQYKDKYYYGVRICCELLDSVRFYNNSFSALKYLYSQLKSIQNRMTIPRFNHIYFDTEYDFMPCFIKMYTGNGRGLYADKYSGKIYAK